MDSFRTTVKEVGKILLLSLQIVAVVSIVSIVIASVVARRFSLALVFQGNLIAAVVIITVGLVIWFFPVSLLARFNKNKLVDYSTVVEFLREERKKKQRKGNETIWIGLSCGIISGVIQILLWMIV